MTCNLRNFLISTTDDFSYIEYIGLDNGVRSRGNLNTGAERPEIQMLRPVDQVGPTEKTGSIVKFFACWTRKHMISPFASSTVAATLRKGCNRIVLCADGFSSSNPQHESRRHHHRQARLSGFQPLWDVWLAYSNCISHFSNL
jgi:hypothetical protein